MASWIQTTTLLSASFITKASHSQFCWRLATHKGNSHTLLVLHGNWRSCPLFISPAPTLHQAPIFSPLDDCRGPLAALPAALLLHLHPHMVRLSSSLATSRTRLLPAVCTGTGAFFGDEHIMLIPATGLLHIFLPRPHLEGSMVAPLILQLSAQPWDVQESLPLQPLSADSFYFMHL